jgi:hypothetical protein
VAQEASTFLDAGWDFVGETANGTEDIWWILEGKDYPRLWWELIPQNRTDFLMSFAASEVYLAVRLPTFYVSIAGR